MLCDQVLQGFDDVPAFSRDCWRIDASHSTPSDLGLVFEDDLRPPTKRWAMVPQAARHNPGRSGYSFPQREYSGEEFSLLQSPLQLLDQSKMSNSSCMGSMITDIVASHRLRFALSRGSSPSGYPAEPLVSYQINRQPSGWNLPPLMIRAFGAHCHMWTYMDARLQQVWQTRTC
jgi:hypothetical protein